MGHRARDMTQNILREVLKYGFKRLSYTKLGNEIIYCCLRMHDDALMFLT